jgi:predicted Zn-dependent protease
MHCRQIDSRVSRKKDISSTPATAATPLWLRAIPAALALCALLVPVATGVVNGQPRTAAGPNDAVYQSACGYFDQGNYSAAEEAFRRLAALEPGNPREIGGIVELYLRQNRVDDAIDLAQSEVDKNPVQTQLRVILGNVYVRAGKDDQAIAEFQRAIDNGAKDQAGLYFRIAEAQHRKGDLDAAVASFDRAHLLAPASLPSLL